MYWNTKSDIIIPNNLWQQTKNLKFQIFEKIKVQDLKKQL